MQFTMSIAMSRPEHLIPLARTAEECGFTQVAVPDSSFWSEQTSDAYPYTTDGSRMWTEHTPFVEPFVAVAAMGAATERIRFCTQVVKVGVRNPLLLAKQIASAAVLTGDRFTFGAGVGWLKEEFDWCGQAYERRGKRVDESLDAMRQILTGDWASYDGEQVRFGRLKMPPTPARRVPFYIGGHTAVALRRTVRFGDGWTSAPITLDELVQLRGELDGMLTAAGRSLNGFAMQVSPKDRFGLEGFRELAAAGATDLVTVPWVFYGVPLDGELEAKQEALRRFAADIISKW